METEIHSENSEISKRLSDVFALKINVNPDGSFEILKPTQYIYKPEILSQYLKFSYLFFQRLSFDNNLFVDNRESYIKNLFEKHLDQFILVLKRILKSDTQEDFDFILKFTGAYFDKHLSTDYILERIVFKFNNNTVLNKYSFLQPYLKESQVPKTNYDSDIFKNEKGFLIFKYFVENHIVDELNDYSYIFQCLLHDKLIHKIKHLDFLKWIKVNKFISDKGVSELEKNGGFRSMSKCKSTSRLNYYIRTKELYLN